MTPSPNESSKQAIWVRLTPTSVTDCPKLINTWTSSQSLLPRTEYRAPGVPSHHPEVGETSTRMILTIGKVQNQESHWEMEPETWWLPLLCTFQLLEPIYSHYFTGNWKFPNWFRRLPETKSKDWFSSLIALEKRVEIQNPDTFVPVL